MKAIVKKVKPQMFAVCNAESEKVLTTDVDGLALQLIYTKKERAEEVAQYINNQNQ